MARARRGRPVIVIVGCAVVIAAARLTSPGGSPEQVRAASASIEPPVPLVAASRGKAEEYGLDSLRHLFGTPAEPAPAPAKPPVSPKPTVPPVPTPQAPSDPLADYEFTGIVTFDGRTLALLENRHTREGAYVAIGDEVAGFRVADVSASGLSLSREEGERRLALNEDYSLSPLGKEAPRTSVASAPAPAVGSGTQILSEPPNHTFVLGYKVLSGFQGAPDVNKLHDEYYAGKLTMDELDARLNSGSTRFLSGYSLSFDVDVKQNLSGVPVRVITR